MKPATTSTVPLLVARITAGIEAWKEAGTILVDLLDNHGLSIDSIVAQADSEFVTADILSKFERIGRQQIVPALLVSNFPAVKYLARLPFSEQMRLMGDTIELMVLKDGKADTLKVEVRNLTASQCAQVFTSEGVRNLPAQRTWLEEQAKVNALPANGTPKYRIIRGGKVVFAPNVEFTVKELAGIVAAAAA